RISPTHHTPDAGPFGPGATAQQTAALVPTRRHTTARFARVSIALLQSIDHVLRLNDDFCRTALAGLSTDAFFVCRWHVGRRRVRRSSFHGLRWWRVS